MQALTSPIWEPALPSEIGKGWKDLRLTRAHDYDAIIRTIVERTRLSSTHYTGAG